MIKKALLFIVIISSFFIGVSLANDKSQQKKDGQVLEQKVNVINETKESSKEKENNDKNKFDFGPLITLIGIFISASLIIWQMGINLQFRKLKAFKLEFGIFPQENNAFTLLTKFPKSAVINFEVNAVFLRR